MSEKLKLEGVLKNGYGIIPKMVMKDKDLSVEAKAVYAYLSSYAGGGTIAFPSVSLICGDLNISKNRLMRHRSDLVNKGYISIHRERLEKGFSKNIYTIHSTVQLHSVDIGNVDIGNLDIGSVDIGNEATNKNSTNNNSINKNTTNTSAELTDDFEKLWQLYPNKQGKKKALTAYKKAVKDGATNKQIQDGIVAYKKFLKREDWQKPAHGSTWFHNERWQDDYTVQTKQEDTSGLSFEEKLARDGVDL